MNGINLRQIADMPEWSQPYVVLAVIATILLPPLGVAWRKWRSQPEIPSQGSNAGVTELAETLANVAREANQARASASKAQLEAQVIRRHLEKICQLVLAAELSPPPAEIDELNNRCKLILQAFDATNLDSLL